MNPDSFTWRGITFAKSTVSGSLHWSSEQCSWTVRRLFDEYLAEEGNELDESGPTPQEALENLRATLIEHHRSMLARLEAMPDA